MNKKYKLILDIVKERLSCAGHDFEHVIRVYHLSLHLAKHEDQVDMDVLVPAVLLHDIARVAEDNDNSGASDHAVIGADMAEEILAGFGWSREKVEKIRHCILSHRFRSGYAPQTVEARILFDADKLDVLGAIGIARSFMLAGQHGERLYGDIPLEEYYRENVGENGRIKDPSKHTANLEFELKLKKIPERLYTERAKVIALERMAYMENFFQTLRKEMNGLK